jgi:hypothetical protein
VKYINGRVEYNWFWITGLFISWRSWFADIVQQKEEICREMVNEKSCTSICSRDVMIDCGMQSVDAASCLSLNLAKSRNLRMNGK